MIETVLNLVLAYGSYIVALSTFLSCLAIPIPASMIMMTAGAFVATGDLSGPGTAGMALAGAVLGDQVGFAIGRSGAPWLWRATGKSARMLDRARDLTARHGAWAVFLSRWLFSPLGPYSNLVAGLTRMDWWRFSVWGSLGEAVWVGCYLGIGFFFASQIVAVADIASNVSGALAAGAVTIGLGWLIWARVKPHEA